MDSQYDLDLILFCLIMAYITLFLKETKSVWNTPPKYLLYAATAITFIFSGLCIGFATTLGYVIFSVFIVVVCLPLLRIFLEKRRKRRRKR